MNHFKLPLILPFKFIPATQQPGRHFDDAWACEQIRSYELKAKYKQKWRRFDGTKLQIECSIAPDALKVYNAETRQLTTTIAWAPVLIAVNYRIYECDFDISALPEGVYYLYQRVALLGLEWAAISEPIHSKNEWPGTMLFKYKHSFNDYDVAWRTGLEMWFRCEADVPPSHMKPKRELTSHVNQTADTRTLKGVPHREFTLYIGATGYDRGVAPWVVDIVNRILLCDSINIDGQFFQSGDSEIEVTAIKGYPLVTASNVIVPAANRMSLEFADTTPLAPGLVVGYNLSATFFGGSALVEVTDVQEQS